jgi:SAM-dependent methyltransferase
VHRAQYGRLLTEAYDLDKPSAPADELAYYLRAIDQTPPPVLAVMCGSGRFLLPILAGGVDIDGVDASFDMLAACRANALELGVEPSLHQQQLHELELPRTYGLMFIGGSSIGLVADLGELREGLRRMHAHLVPGGHLLLEIQVPPASPPHRGRNAWRGTWWTRPNGDRIVLRQIGDYDPATRIETGLGIYDLYEGSTLVATELNDWIHRYWDPGDFSEELTAAGFDDIQLTRAFTAEALTGDEDTVSIRCRKPA